MTHNSESIQVLQSSLTLPCGAILKNRLVKSPMSDSLADGEGNPTETQIRLYERWAKGGAAVSFIGEVQGDPRFPEKPGNLVLGPHSNQNLLQVFTSRAVIFQVTGMVLCGLIIFTCINFRLEIHVKGILFSLLAGLCGAAGALLYLVAVNKGKVSGIVFISALYPIITVLLSYIFLEETITVKEFIGMAFACIAIILFST